MKHVVWLDLETTGLEPENNDILEIGMVITDHRYHVVDTFHRVLRSSIPSRHWDAPALEMHEKSGLLTEVLNSNYAMTDLRGEITDFIKRHFGESETPMLAGSSIHFDRRFLDRHMRGIHSRFHYRHIDVSGIREYVRFFHGLSKPEASVREKKHRVLADIADSIALAEALGRCVRPPMYSFDELFGGTQ